MFRKIQYLIPIYFLTVFSCLYSEMRYEVHDIDTMQTCSSGAIDINNNGQVLGWYRIDSQSDIKFFIRDKDGSFHEIPATVDEMKVKWMYITNDSTAYGTFNKNNNVCTPILFKWDPKNGVINLGELPGDISAINDHGQVLIRTIKEVENGETINYVAIWEDGNITKMKQLAGDLGIESVLSAGLDINNHGEVVGYSHVYLSYKNELYKQCHATKWVDGEPIDLHYTLPKDVSSSANSINDLGEIIFNNTGMKINNNFSYKEKTIYNNKSSEYLPIATINNLLKNDLNSIWMNVIKFIKVNDNGEIIAEGKTIYGETHAMLLIPENNQ